MKTVTLGNSDEDADWLKKLRGGKYQEQDLQASDDALRKHRKNIVNVLKHRSKFAKGDQSQV